MTERHRCLAVSRKGWRCDFMEHPGQVHWTWINGWPTAWMWLPDRDESWQNEAPTEDPLRDAPPALRET